MTTTTSTTSTSATQSLVSQLGAGSGIDMAALATNLANAQFASKVDRLTAKSETLTAQISAASNMKAMLLNFSTSVGDLVRTGSLSPQPQFAGASVASGTLSGTRTPSGSYSLEVTQLAKSQTLVSAAYAGGTAATVVDAGKLTLSFGTVSGSGFEPKRDSVEIAIGAGATLNDVANAINAKKTGVTAYVAQTDAGAQLVFKGQEGAANGFKIDAEGAGLANLAWDPEAAGAPERLLATAGDASFKVDGLVRTSTSNTVSEAIPGVTLKLTAVSTGTPPVPTTVTFTDTSAALSTTMNDLTGALNEIASALNAATDPTSGDLRADSGARALKKAFSQLAGSTVMPSATGAAKTLADLGLSTQRDGTFVLDTNRLKATLAKDPDGVASMFTTGLYGVYATVDKLYRNATAASDPGSLGGSITRFTKQLSQVKEDQTTVAEKQETLRANLTARFAVSDSRISASQSTLSFIQNQIAAWNKSDS